MFSKQLYSLSLFLTIELCFGNTVDVSTTSGVIRGQAIEVLNKNVEQFLGIPYAQPPTGLLRFDKPKPIEKPLEGVIDGSKYRLSCMQHGIDVHSISEDCLFLNIWSPESDDQNSTQLKPVMFWIHGGALVVGSSFGSNGSAIAAQDVVLVTINYRLGIFGFLYGGVETAPGNVGLYDQLLALKWVRENIHLFGGDKDQITIFGQSAGSWSVSALILTPLAKGLFKRAIMESAANLFNKDRDVFTKEEELIKSLDIAKRVNCLNDKQMLECLRGVDANVLLNSKPTALDTFPLSGTEYLPNHTQNAFKQLQFNQDLELMVGVAETEGSALAKLVSPKVMGNITKKDFLELVVISDMLLHNIDMKSVVEFYVTNVNTNSSDALKWAFYQLWGDLLINCPTYFFALNYAFYSPKSSVYFYEITYQRTDKLKGLPNYGVTHGAEIDFIYGLPLIEPLKTDTQTDIDFSKELLKIWTDFAKNGKPNTNWPQLINTEDKNPIPKIQELNPNKMNHIFDDLFHKTCEGVWKTYFI